MNKIKMLVLAFIAMFALVMPMAQVPTANASSTDYTRLYRPARGWTGDVVVICHYLQQPSSMSWYEDSVTSCPVYNGWVNKIGSSIPSYYRVHVLNQVTGNQTDYPCGASPSIGGGNYDMWVNGTGC